MSNTTESAYEYFESFSTGMKEHYDSLLAEIAMAACATARDYKHIGMRFGYITVMQIIAENIQTLLENNFQNLQEKNFNFLQAHPELFLAQMIIDAEDACSTPTVAKQVAEIIKRDYTELSAEQTLFYLEEGAARAAEWMRDAIGLVPIEEDAAITSEEPLMILG